MPLNRTPEPEVMNTADEAVTYDEMDHSAVNRQFVEDLLTFQRPSGEVFDLGTGTARIPIELCRQCAEVRVIAVDLSIQMLDVARLNLEVAGLVDRIMLDHVDAKGIKYPTGHFQMVLSNSLIHHMPKPEMAIREAVRVTEPGGCLFFRDLIRPDSAETVHQLVEKYAGKESIFAQELFRNSLHAALTLNEIQALVSQLGFAPETVASTSDRHWTWSAQTLQRDAPS